jgi:hypothetical protein
MAARIIIILIALSPIISLLVYKYVRNEPLFRADVKSLVAVAIALAILFVGLIPCVCRKMKQQSNISTRNGRRRWSPPTRWFSMNQRLPGS